MTGQLLTNNNIENEESRFGIWSNFKDVFIYPKENIVTVKFKYSHTNHTKSKDSKHTLYNPIDPTKMIKIQLTNGNLSFSQESSNLYNVDLELINSFINTTTVNFEVYLYNKTESVTINDPT